MATIFSSFPLSGYSNWTKIDSWKSNSSEEYIFDPISFILPKISFDININSKLSFAEEALNSNDLLLRYYLYFSIYYIIYIFLIKWIFYK